jgi:hypothetical protein
LLLDAFSSWWTNLHSVECSDHHHRSCFRCRALPCCRTSLTSVAYRGCLQRTHNLLANIKSALVREGNP